MLLTCPNCGIIISTKNIDVSMDLAKCQSCTYQASISAALNIKDDANFKTIPRQVNGIDIQETSNNLLLTIHWNALSESWLYWLLGIVVGIGMSFLFAYLQLTESVPIYLSIFLVLLILSGWWMLYQALLNKINKTIINVSEKGLQVRHVPISLGKYKPTFYEKKQIKQLFLQRERAGEVNDKPIYKYSLNVLLEDNQKKMILDIFKEIEYVHYLENKIEKRLKIKDMYTIKEFIPGVESTDETYRKALEYNQYFRKKKSEK